MNKTLFISGNSSSSLCLFCKNADETILHLFNEFNITRESWKNFIYFFDKCLNLPYLMPQTAFFGFTDTYCNDILFKTTFFFLTLIFFINQNNITQYNTATLDR